MKWAYDHIDSIDAKPSQLVQHKEYCKHEPTLVKQRSMCSNQIQERKVGYNLTVCDNKNQNEIRMANSLS
jgi:hypothetical protein